MLENGKKEKHEEQVAHDEKAKAMKRVRLMIARRGR